MGIHMNDYRDSGLNSASEGSIRPQGTSVNVAARTSTAANASASQSAGSSPAPVPGPVVSKALTDAGLPDTPRNRQIVSSLISQELPIDAETLKSVARTMSSYPNESIDAVILLQSAGVEVTPSSLSDANAFLAARDMLLDALYDIDSYIEKYVADRITDSSAFSGEASQPVFEYGSLTPPEGNVPDQSAIVSSPNGSVNQPFSESSATGNAAEQVSSEYSPAGNAAEQVPSEYSPAGNAAEHVPSQSFANDNITEQLPLNSTPQDGMTHKNTAGFIQGQIHSESGADGNAAGRVTSESGADGNAYGRVTSGSGADGNAYGRVTSESVTDGNAAEQILSGSTLRDDITQTDTAGFSQGKIHSESDADSNAAGRVTSESGADGNTVGRVPSESVAGGNDAANRMPPNGSSIKEMPLKELLTALSAKPGIERSDISSEGIKRFLESAVSYLENARELSHRSGDEAMSAKVDKAMNSMKMLLKLNDMYAYAEVPVKNEDENRQTHLRFFANKKSRIRKDEGSSAVLHLNMPALKELDVKLVLKGNSLKVDFFSSKDASALLEADSDSLSEKLKRIGVEPAIDFRERTKNDPALDPSNISGSELPSAGQNINGFDTLA